MRSSRAWLHPLPTQLCSFGRCRAPSRRPGMGVIPKPIVTGIQNTPRAVLTRKVRQVASIPYFIHTDWRSALARAGWARSGAELM